MKLTKILVTAVVLLCFSFTCIGYAALTDELTITGTVTYTPPPKVIDYLYVSAATVSSGDVVSNDGSSDLFNPMGWVTLSLNFASLSDVKTVTVDITNATASTGYLYRNMEVNLISGDGTAPTATVTSGLIEGELNSNGEIIADSGATAIAAGQTISDIKVTVTPTSVGQQSITLVFYFGFGGEADKEEAENQVTVNNALESLKNTLDGNNLDAYYSDIQSSMIENEYDYVGNVSGNDIGDTALMEKVFGDSLDSVTFDPDSEGTKCTVMLKGIDLDPDGNVAEEPEWWEWGKENYCDDDYERIVMYLTSYDFINDPIPKGSSYWGMYESDEKIVVYAAVLERSTDSEGKTVWHQVGGIYKGLCNANVYQGQQNETRTNCDSFNTDSWRADTDGDSNTTNGTQSFTTIEDNGSNMTYTITDNMTVEQALAAYKARK